MPEDMLTNSFKHQRDTFDYIDINKIKCPEKSPENAFLKALNQSRLHHAWLLCGPQGLGKATFAYKIARFLLSKSHDSTLAGLNVPESDVDAQLISAQSHPDLIALERQVTGTKTAKNITVEAVRGIGEFFSKAPSRGQYRVCIIDAVDDLNVNSSNALLKILEEPPEQGILLLISHSPGRLLPTIRSRCRRLSFAPWSDQDVKSFLENRSDANADELERICRLANGAPGKALSLWKNDAVEMDELAAKILDKTSALSRLELTKYANGFKTSNTKTDGHRKYTQFLECLLGQITLRSLQADTQNMANQWSSLWFKLSGVIAETEGLNLDRSDYFWSIIHKVKTHL